MVVEIEDAKRAAKGGAQLLGNSAYIEFYYHHAILLLRLSGLGFAKDS
jgi:hypothetical protein